MIDVIIPTHNSSLTILETLSSVYRFPELSAIVIDDHSSDETLIKINESGCRLFVSENFGAYDARAKGILGSCAEYIIFLDSDDLLENGWVEGLRILKENPKIVGVGGRIINFGPKRTATTNIDSRLETTQTLLGRGYGPWPISGSIWRRSAIEGGILHEIPALKPSYAEDYEMIVRGSLIGDIKNINEVMCKYRVTSGKSQRDPSSSLRSAQSISVYYQMKLNMALTAPKERDIQLLSSRRRIQISCYQNGVWKTLYNFFSSFEGLKDVYNFFVLSVKMSSRVTTKMPVNGNKDVGK
jgi:glycosyltransferase involved in cell wall biosynthesis